MPYKHIHYKIKEGDDKRIKLTDSDRLEIKKAYGKVSQRKLAKFYGVSRRLIIFIGCPEKQKENLQRREERGGTMNYYSKEKHRIAMKKHRQHKQELYLQNKLEVSNDDCKI